jgi:hypothetical protein
MNPTISTFTVTFQGYLLKLVAYTFTVYGGIWISVFNDIDIAT